ncbi:MAG: ABC transporter ATP-binding protein [Clostridia bacterium]|nr:ABC transporter ATP-binding protein [Clostridia bacterium]
MANLRLTGVSKIYPSGKMALYNVSFSSSEGEFIAITGGASCGKSTLLRIIAGLEECSAGDIFIGDKKVNDVDPKDRDVAMIFQSNTLYPTLTLFDNIAFGLKMRNVPAAVIEQRVKTVAEILGLTDVLYRKPKTVTAAQRQLATYGRAIAREPKLYLLDEPINGLDPNLRTYMKNVLVNLQVRMKGTFLYATKNIADAMSMASRIVVLKDGFVQQIDTPSNLYDYPANAYVGFFVGNPTMNLLQNVAVVREEDGVYAVFDDLKLKLSDKTVSRWSNIDEYIGTDKKVILGIRPEDITPDGEGSQIEGVVCGTDDIDGVKLAELDISKNHSLTVFMEGGVKGDKHGALINTERLYVFDGETQLTLLSRDEGYVKDAKNSEADFKPLTKAETEDKIIQYTPVAEKPAKKKH